MTAESLVETMESIAIKTVTSLDSEEFQIAQPNLGNIFSLFQLNINKVKYWQ